MRDRRALRGGHVDRGPHVDARLHVESELEADLGRQLARLVVAGLVGELPGELPRSGRGVLRDLELPREVERSLEDRDLADALDLEILEPGARLERARRDPGDRVELDLDRDSVLRPGRVEVPALRDLDVEDGFEGVAGRGARPRELRVHGDRNARERGTCDEERRRQGEEPAHGRNHTSLPLDERSGVVPLFPGDPVIGRDSVP